MTKLLSQVYVNKIICMYLNDSYLQPSAHDAFRAKGDECAPQRPDGQHPA